MEIREWQWKMIYIYQTMRLIENALIRHPDEAEEYVRDIVKERLTDKSLTSDLFLYRLGGCYIPKIVKHNIMYVFTPQFVSNYIKTTLDSHAATGEYPLGLSMRSLLGKDSEGNDIWDIIRNNSELKSAINYIKIKNPRSVTIV